MQISGGTYIQATQVIGVAETKSLTRYFYIAQIGSATGHPRTFLAFPLEPTAISAPQPSAKTRAVTAGRSLSDLSQYSTVASPAQLQSQTLCTVIIKNGSDALELNLKSYQPTLLIENQNGIPVAEIVRLNGTDFENLAGMVNEFIGADGDNNEFIKKFRKTFLPEDKDAQPRATPWDNMQGAVPVGLASVIYANAPNATDETPIAAAMRVAALRPAHAAKSRKAATALPKATREFAPTPAPVAANAPKAAAAPSSAMAAATQAAPVTTPKAPEKTADLLEEPDIGSLSLQAALRAGHLTLLQASILNAIVTRHHNGQKQDPNKITYRDAVIIYMGTPDHVKDPVSAKLSLTFAKSEMEKATARFSFLKLDDNTPLSELHGLGFFLSDMFYDMAQGMELKTYGDIKAKYPKDMDRIFSPDLKSNFGKFIIPSVPKPV